MPETPITTAATVAFIVEHQSDWYGDAEWFPVEAGRYPVRFTQQEAEAYIDQQIETDYQRQVAEYAKCKPDADRAREMRCKRKECLEAAGLGKQEWESFYPLVVHGVPCKEPVRMDRARFRVRTLSDWEADD